MIQPSILLYLYLIRIRRNAVKASSMIINQIGFVSEVGSSNTAYPDLTMGTARITEPISTARSITGNASKASVSRIRPLNIIVNQYLNHGRNTYLNIWIYESYWQV